MKENEWSDKLRVNKVRILELDVWDRMREPYYRRRRSRVQRVENSEKDSEKEKKTERMKVCRCKNLNQKMEGNNEM